jgi:hypothetical protein
MHMPAEGCNPPRASAERARVVFVLLRGCATRCGLEPGRRRVAAASEEAELRRVTGPISCRGEPNPDLRLSGRAAVAALDPRRQLAVTLRRRRECRDERLAGPRTDAGSGSRRLLPP